MGLGGDVCEGGVGGFVSVGNVSEIGWWLAL